MKVIFDLDYTEFMNKKELKSVAHQIAISYSLNKTVKYPFCYYLSGYTGIIKEELEKMGSAHWLVNRREPYFYKDDIFTNKVLVYLSPDSDNVLKEIKGDEVFIVGGYVDKPVDKYKSLKKADLYNLKTCKLPITEYINDATSTVLNINTVLEVISNYLESKDWGSSLKNALPKRKMNEKKDIIRND